jgi:hypothetical protein
LLVVEELSDDYLPGGLGLGGVMLPP